MLSHSLLSVACTREDVVSDGIGVAVEAEGARGADE